MTRLKNWLDDRRREPLLPLTKAIAMTMLLLAVTVGVFSQGTNTTVTDNGKTYQLPSQAMADLRSGKYADAFNGLKPLADSGNAAAQHLIAQLYYAGGNGVTQDYKEAMNWLVKSAGQGYSKAEYMIGAMDLSGVGVPANDKEALRWFQIAAAHGDADAQAELGVLYFQGDIVAKDDVLAASWFKKAADQEDGSGMAAFNLSICYYNGSGVEKNLSQMAEYLHTAIRRGYKAEVALGNLTYLAETAQVPKAQAYLSDIYMRGIGGVDKDLSASLTWAKRAADAGDAAGQWLLYCLSTNGVGNSTDGLYSLRNSARQGQAQAVEELEKLKANSGMIITNYKYKDGTFNQVEEAAGDVGYSVKTKK